MKQLEISQVLLAYVQGQMALQAQAYALWKQAGGPEGAAYRSGMWWAYRDIEKLLSAKIDEFPPDK
jgi:hypothetical protein